METTAGPRRDSGQFRDYSVYFTCTEAWAYFQSLVLCLPDSQQHGPALATYLLELNDRIHWAEFNLRTANGPGDGEPVDLVLMTAEGTHEWPAAEALV